MECKNKWNVLQFSSVLLLSRVQLSVTPWTATYKPPCSSGTPRVYSNSCPLSWWCHPTIWPSVVPFSSHFQSFPALGSFQMSQFFTSGGQSIGISTSASVLPINIQDWFPLELTSLISLQPKGLSRVFSNLIVQKYQFFSVQPSLRSNSHIHTWLLEYSIKSHIFHSVGDMEQRILSSSGKIFALSCP